MSLNILLLIFGLILLALGGEILIRGSSALAIRSGLTPLVVGLTVVAFGTSAPELLVSLSASFSNKSGIAVGNIVGSNILNIGVVLALASVFKPINVRLQVIKYDAPIMVALSFLTLFLLNKGYISRTNGILLFFLLVVYVCFTVLFAKKNLHLEVEREFQEGIPLRSKSIYYDVIFLIGGLLLLIAGARLMVTSAVYMARYLGVSEAVIGITIVAIGTSLPEIAASIAAVLRHQSDIAVGNAIGSNIFNILCVLGASSMVKPMYSTGITNIDLWVMVIFSVALLPLLFTGFKLQRWEGGVLLLGYIVYLWALWP